jgi:hypothetical protein
MLWKESFNSDGPISTKPATYYQKSLNIKKNVTFGTGNPNPKMWLYGVMRIKIYKS